MKTDPQLGFRVDQGFPNCGTRTQDGTQGHARWYRAFLIKSVCDP